MMTNKIKEVAYTRLTKKQVQSLAQAIYRFAKEKEMKMGEFCRVAGLRVDIPSNLYHGSIKKMRTYDIDGIVLATGHSSFEDTLAYGEASGGVTPKNLRLKKRKKSRAMPIVQAPSPTKLSVTTFAEQLNAFGKEDQEKVKKLVLFLYNKSTLQTLSDEVRSFCEV